MAITSEAQLLALFQEALKAGGTSGRATSRQLAIWGLKITYIFKVQSDDPLLARVQKRWPSEKSSLSRLLSNMGIFFLLSSRREEIIEVETKFGIISHHLNFSQRFVDYK